MVWSVEITFQSNGYLIIQSNFKMSLIIFTLFGHGHHTLWKKKEITTIQRPKVDLAK